MFVERENSLSLMLSDLVQGTVIDRPNRFLVYADVDGKRIMAHIADSGRLRELIFPGNVVMLKSAASLERKHPRKTSHDVVMGLSSETKKVWVSVDTRYPNILFGEALRRRLIHEFFQYSLVRPEFSFGTVNGSGKKAVRSRLDFLLEGEGIQKALLEVKSVTLAKGNTGFFPDAPTERGTRHLKELEKALGDGYSSFGVFVAQREDIETIVPNSQTDPVFSQAMKDAQENGVRFLGYRCKVSPSSITLQLKSIPVIPC